MFKWLKIFNRKKEDDLVFKVGLDISEFNKQLRELKKSFDCFEKEKEFYERFIELRKGDFNVFEFELDTDHKEKMLIWARDEGEADLITREYIRQVYGLDWEKVEYKIRRPV